MADDKKVPEVVDVPKGVKRGPYRLPELLAADPNRPVFIVQKEKDADRLAELGEVATCNLSAAGKWPPEYNKYFSGRYVVLLPNNNEAGNAHAEAVAKSLSGSAARIQVTTLPNVPPKGTISDWLGPYGDAGDLEKLIIRRGRWMSGRRTIRTSRSRLAEEKSSAKNERPRILVDPGRDSETIQQSLEALSGSTEIFQRGGILVDIVSDAKPPPGIARPANAPRIAVLPRARLRELLSQSAAFFKFSGHELKPIHTPAWVLIAISARRQWDNIRRIEAVTETPLLRADGSVISKPGYDAETGILYAPRDEFPDVPERPTLADAERARDELLDVVGDFPFEAESHKSTWLAAFLTLFVRHAFHGCVPFFLFDANVRGSGKGLLADCIIIIATGREAARTTAPKTDEECRKRITSIALAAEPVMLLDNVAGVLDLPSFNAALTATTWNDRILGVSEMTGRLPLNTIWLGTGNNVALGEDTMRRTAHIRLQSPLERPELRDDFMHPNLLGWVRKNRPCLAVAALTFLRAYFVAGKPDMGLPAWGSFEEWSRLVRNAVVWVGMPDPADARIALMDRTDRSTAELRALIAGWQEMDPAGKGMNVGEMLKMLDAKPDEFQTLRGVLLEMSNIAGKLPTAKSIGMKLHHSADRIIDGKCFVREEKGGGVLWAVRDVSDERKEPD